MDWDRIGRIGRAPAACLKRGYLSKRDALASHARFGGRLRVYYCEYCRLWHVTASEKR